MEKQIGGPIKCSQDIMEAVRNSQMIATGKGRAASTFAMFGHKKRKLQDESGESLK